MITEPCQLHQKIERVQNDHEARLRLVEAKVAELDESKKYVAQNLLRLDALEGKRDAEQDVQSAEYQRRQNAQDAILVKLQTQVGILMAGIGFATGIIGAVVGVLFTR